MDHQHSKHRRGQSTTEYGIALSLIAVLAVVALLGVNNAIGAVFSSVSDRIQAVVGAPAPSSPPVLTAVVTPDIQSVGQDVTVTGSGYTPDSTVTITLHSTPVVLGTTTSDTAGNVSAVVTIPLDTDTAITHTITLSTTTQQGISNDLTVTAPTTLTAPILSVGLDPNPLYAYGPTFTWTGDDAIRMYDADGTLQFLNFPDEPHGNSAYGAVNLIPGTTYTGWYVIAWTWGLDSLPSNPVSFTVRPADFNATGPNFLSEANLAAGSHRFQWILNWSDVSGVAPDHFALYNEVDSLIADNLTVSSDYYGPISESMTGNSAVVNGLDLLPNTTYSGWYLVAYNANGNPAARSYPFTFTTLPAAPVLSVSVSPQSNATFTWTGEGNAFTLFDGSNGSRGYTNGTTLTVGGLSPDASYSGWYVVAYGSAGPSPHSNAVDFTTPPLPVPAAPVLSVAVYPGRETFTWTGEGNIFFFTLFDGSNGSRGSTNGTTLTVGGLSPGTVYSGWYVVAFNNYGPSPHSNAVSFTTGQ
jgi:Flp pilus assembly pilin Flp